MKPSNRPPLRAALALGVALLVGCSSARPMGEWYTRNDNRRTGRMSCAPAEELGPLCASVAVPETAADGPRYIIGDTQRLGPFSANGDSLFFAQPYATDASEICSAPAGGGSFGCFASVGPHHLLDLQPLGEDWLVGLLGRQDEGPTLARVHRRKHDVEYQRIGEPGAWTIAMSLDGAGGMCVVVGRPGPGHAENGLLRVVDLAAPAGPTLGVPPIMVVPFGQVVGDAVDCDEADAYFNGTEGLARVPLRGGAATVLGTSGSRIALSLTHVYVASTRGIERLPKGGTEITLLAPVANAGLGWNAVPEMLATTGGVAWREKTFPHRRGDELASRIRRCVGGQCETIVESAGELRLVAESDGVLYWSQTMTTRYGKTDALFAARGPKAMQVAD